MELPELSAVHSIYLQRSRLLLQGNLTYKCLRRRLHTIVSITHTHMHASWLCLILSPPAWLRVFFFSCYTDLIYQKWQEGVFIRAIQAKNQLIQLTNRKNRKKTPWQSFHSPVAHLLITPQLVQRLIRCASRLPPSLSLSVSVRQVWTLLPGGSVQKINNFSWKQKWHHEVTFLLSG